jgi:tripartite-type tricarboxylate transporter receptor subunit TctC
MAPLNAVLAHIQAGKLVAIAVTDAERAAELPNVPTLREAGVQSLAPVSSWFGILTAPNTPPEILARLNAEVNKALQAPDVAAKLKEQTFVLIGGSSADLGKLMREEAERNAAIVRIANIKME